MRTRTVTLLSVGFTLSILLFFAGCSKSTIIINQDAPDDGESGSGTSVGKTLVTFSASIESRNMTRSMSPMRQGIQSKLFAFGSASNNSFATPAAQGSYTTSSPGVLSGTDGYKMYLPNGAYDFYAVSDNYSTFPITFTNGESEPLFNGIDYLWWKSPEQDVNSSQVNVPIVFLHVATQVVFQITAGKSIELNKLLSATITPPSPGARMNLGNGVIPPTTTYGKVDKMGTNGFLAQYIMLPLQTNTPMTLNLELMADGESFSRNYSVEVPVPNGALKAGNSYVFEAVIDGNSISFPSVSIKSWTEVDETGNPLYPTQE